MALRIRLRALLLDNDGVLIDSVGVSIEAHRKLARRLDLRIPTRAEFRRAWIAPWETGILPALWPDDHERFREVYLAEYGKQVRYRTFPGITEMLGRLSRSGVKLAIVSMRDRDSLLKRLTDAGIVSSMFEVISSLDDQPFHKPDPRVFESVWARIATDGIRKKDAAYVGDTLVDYYAARGFGIQFIAVESCLASRRDFERAGVPPAFILKSPGELLNIVACPSPR